MAYDRNKRAQDICDINQVQTSSIRRFTYWHDYFIYLLGMFYFFVVFLLLLLLAHQIQFRSLRWLQTFFMLPIRLKFVLRLLHFLCVLEFVRLNFSDPYLMQIYKWMEKKRRKTLFIYRHIWITCRILHTQIELNFSHDTLHFLDVEQLIRKLKKVTTISLVNYFFCSFGKRSIRFVVELNLCSNIIEYIYYIFVLCVGCCTCCTPIV